MENCFYDTFKSMVTHGLTAAKLLSPRLPVTMASKSAVTIIIYEGKQPMEEQLVITMHFLRDKLEVMVCGFFNLTPSVVLSL